MSSPAPDEAASGYDYEPGLQIAENLLVNQGHDDWQVDALCHEQYDVFDLVSDPDGRARDKALRNENNYRAKAARRICFECPVFQECYDTTWAERIIPVGVNRAGAKLSSPFQHLREQALLKSYALWLGHQSRKRALWKKQKAERMASSKKASSSPRNHTPKHSSPVTPRKH